jgi:hypothetical protein
MSALVARGEGRSPTRPIGLRGWEAMIHFANPTPAYTLPPRPFSPLNNHPRLGDR